MAASTALKAPRTAATAKARGAGTARARARATAAPARRTTTPRREPARGRTPARQPTGWMSPVAAVGRTAVAVGGIADSGLVFRLTRGRLWIGLLGTLLVGIVGLNVVALSFSATSSEAAGKAEELRRQNSALEAQLASMLSADELEQVADDLGLHVPVPGAIRYVKSSPDDAAVAAKRLKDGELSAATTPAPVVPDTTVPPVTDTTVVTDPAAVTPPVDPAATAPVDPAATAPVTETAVAPAVGGVPSP